MADSRQFPVVRTCGVLSLEKDGLGLDDIA